MWHTFCTRCTRIALRIVAVLQSRGLRSARTCGDFRQIYPKQEMLNLWLTGVMRIRFYKSRTGAERFRIPVESLLNFRINRSRFSVDLRIFSRPNRVYIKSSGSPYRWIYTDIVNTKMINLICCGINLSGIFDLGNTFNTIAAHAFAFWMKFRLPVIHFFMSDLIRCYF